MMEKLVYWEREYTPDDKFRRHNVVNCKCEAHAAFKLTLR